MRALIDNRISYAPYAPAYVPYTDKGTYENAFIFNALSGGMYRMHPKYELIRSILNTHLYYVLYVYICLTGFGSTRYIHSAKRLFLNTFWYAPGLFEVHTAHMRRTYRPSKSLKSNNFPKMKGCIRYASL